MSGEEELEWLKPNQRDSQPEGEKDTPEEPGIFTA